MMRSIRSVVTYLILLFLLAPEALAQETLHATVDPRLPEYKPARELSGALVTIESEWMDALMKSWIAGFSRLYPAVTFSTLKRDTVGAMGVEPALTGGRIHLGPVSRELMPFEIDRFRKKYGYEPLGIRVGLGSYRATDRVRAITFFVNESNPIKQMTLAQLDAIYCTGRRRGYPEDIITWGQLGLVGEWADREILPLGLQQPEGTGNFVRLEVCRDGEFKKNIHELKPGLPVKSLDRLVKIVADNPSTIGYAGFDNRKPGTKAVRIAETESGPYYSGTFEEVTTARYPLDRFIYIYVNRAPGTALDPALREFLRYVLSREGQQSVEKEGVMLPLPARIAAAELSRLD